MARDEFGEVEILSSGKRCGVQWTPWMGDWAVSWSPRNGNSNAEGPWDHWVDLALMILRHPATHAVYPDAYEAAQGVPPRDFYDETNRDLSPEECERFFGGTQ